MIGPTAFFCFNGDLLMVIGGDADDQLGGQPFLPLQLSNLSSALEMVSAGGVIDGVLESVVKSRVRKCVHSNN